jgi:hypothetical protein
MYWVELPQDSIHLWALANSNDLSGSIRGMKYLDKISDYQTCQLVNDQLQTISVPIIKV